MEPFQGQLSGCVAADDRDPAVSSGKGRSRTRTPRHEQFHKPFQRQLRGVWPLWITSQHHREGAGWTGMKPSEPPAHWLDRPAWSTGPKTSSRSSARASRLPSTDRTANSTRATTAAPTRQPPTTSASRISNRSAARRSTRRRRLRPPGTIPSGPGVPRIPPPCRGPRPGHQSQTASCLPILLHLLRPRRSQIFAAPSTPRCNTPRAVSPAINVCPEDNAAGRFPEGPPGPRERHGPPDVRAAGVGHWAPWSTTPRPSP